ncbi:MAG: DUF4857 domain-containing protein [Bacteroidales bacterium]|jgi:hypothetical protein|nr:DUF4857 domain-containing protein [Bacteroidales bacterium]
MRHQKIIRLFIVFTATLVFAWAIPAVVKLGASSPQRYPFVYYSSVLEQFCFNKDGVRSDASGRIYTEAQFDSVMPMLYYRQLSVNGKMPDSIRGQAITMPQIRTNTVSYRFTPKEISSPDMGLYIMYESMPKRVNLESPGDLFRLKDRIEFIDIATNTVNEEKSALFAGELAKRGFHYPAQWSQGILTTRKAYDEGYFTLDAAGELFHIKMVNGKPFVRNTHVAESIEVVHFAMTQASNKRFYGFLYDVAGKVYILEAPGYRPIQLDIPPIDLHATEITILGNLFFWTVTLTDPDGRRYYALDNDSLKQADHTAIAATPTPWDKLSRWLFPAFLTFEHKNSGYISPSLHFTAWTALIVNLLAAVAFAVFARLASKKRRRTSVLRKAAYILITGIAGLAAVLIIPDE